MEFAASPPAPGNTSDFPIKEQAPAELAIPPSMSSSFTSTDKILCMLRKWWYLGLFLAVLLIIVLAIGCLATPRWIETGSDSMSIEGGLLSCSSCDEPFSDMSYGEAATADACDSFMPDYSGYCDMFSDLKGAGGAFLFFELVTLVFLIFWAVKLFLLFKGSEILNRPLWLFYVVSTVATSSHVLALIVWGGVSSATFSGSCGDWSPDGSKPELCSTDGPKLAIAILVFLLVTTVTFWIVHCKVPPLANRELTFRPAEFAGRSLDPEQRQPGFERAIELHIPNNI